MADFPNAVTAPLERLRAMRQSATDFASEVTSLLTELVGDNNPFGTAALREVGNAAGEVPVLDTTGKIPPAVLPEATADARGTVVLARGIQDARPGVVPTAAQIAALTAVAGTGLNAANFTITQLQHDVAFTAPAIGLVMVASAGGGGHRPPAARADYLTDGRGTPARDSFMFYGPQVSNNSSRDFIRVRGGLGGGEGDQNRRGGVEFPVINAVAGAPDFAMLLIGKGAPGGDPGAFDPDTRVVGGAVAGVPGNSGNLMLAKVALGATVRVRLAGAGAGAAALPQAANQRSVAGGRGLDGFAYFVRLA